MKDASTYWDCEEYTKAWGHGPKLNPLPKESVPRERPPMRDRTWFPTATKIPRLPKPMVPVPHKGKQLYNMKDYYNFELRFITIYDFITIFLSREVNFNSKLQRTSVL